MIKHVKHSFCIYSKLAHWLPSNIDIARAGVGESTDVDDIPVANIAINAWFYDSSSAESPRART